MKFNKEIKSKVSSESNGCCCYRDYRFYVIRCSHQGRATCVESQYGYPVGPTLNPSEQACQGYFVAEEVAYLASMLFGGTRGGVFTPISFAIITTTIDAAS